MNFKRNLRLLMALLLVALYADARPHAAAQQGLPTAEEINAVLKDLSDITGFRIKRQLPFEMVTRDQVNRYLKDQIRTSVKPAEIHAEEVTLKKFGFVPKDFDLKKTTIDLLTEQAAAFYDFHRKKLFISDWAAENMRDEALVHELGHALADQNFPIQKFLAGGSDDSEASLARQTVVEGQATWLVLEYAARKAGKTLADPAVADMLLRSPSESADADYPVFNNAPLYLRITLVFPYDQGQKFQQALFLKEGKRAFSQVFEKPPSSTAQLLHPDLYFSGITPTNPALPKPAQGMKVIAEGTAGELDQRVILRQTGDKDLAESLAPKLKGSSYRVEEPKRGGSATLLYLSDWESEEAAAQYFSAWQKADRAKWKQVDATTESANLFQGKSEDGYFRVTLKGTRVTAEEGFQRPFAEAAF
jgi:hypothetical protein